MSDLIDDDYPFDWRSGDLMNWIKQQPGARVSPCIRLEDLRGRGAGRGVVATRDIGPDEELFKIPLSSVLSVKTSSLIKTHLGPTVQRLDEWLALTLALLFEQGQGDSSKWSAYLKVLPATFDTLMHWTQLELDELRGCKVLDKIGKEDAEKAFNDQLLPIIKKNSYMFPQFKISNSANSLDASLLKSAHMMATLIMAYAFDLEEEQEDSASDDDSSDIPNLPKGMVPLADMLNADGDRNNAHLVQNEDSLCMVALKPIERGEEIFNDYGRLPRSDLLRRYGYITDNYKKWDAVEIDASMLFQVIREDSPIEERSLERRSDLARRWGVLEESFELRRDETPAGFSIEPALYLLVDALTMDSAVMQEEFDANEIPEEPRFTHEMGILLKKLLQARLKGYKTTMAEDAALLQDDHLPRRLQMAVEVRLGEKELIVTAIDGLQHQIDNVSGAYCIATADGNGEYEDDRSQGAQSKKRKT